MPREAAEAVWPAPGRSRPTPLEWIRVGLLQVLFLLTAFVGLNSPFVSTHFVRQNYTFDVARHVFHDGFSSAATPKGSFSQLSDPADVFSRLPVPTPRFTICHLEVPFYGIIGWPAAVLFTDYERAVVRLVAVAFALLSVRFLYLVIRCWQGPSVAFLGTAIWTLAPLVLQFGQVPMPDILTTAGMAAAFYFALRGNLIASSGAFLFCVLAKMSTVPYGLPILVALLIARDCRSFGSCLKLALLWGAAPLLGLAAWLSLSLHDPPGSWVVVGGYQPGGFGHVGMKDLTNPSFYIFPLVFVFPFGTGLIGLLGLVFAWGGARRMNHWLKLSILASLVFTYSMEDILCREPQYTLPVLFWVTLAASFGFPRLFEILKRDERWRITAGAIVCLHIALVIGDTWFLKASRVPNVTDIAVAGSHTPPNSRLVVYSSVASQPPPVWLNRNTLSFNPVGTDPAQLEALNQRLKDFQKAGFDYFVLLDIEHHFKINWRGGGQSVYATDFTNPASPIRQFIEQRHRKIYEGDHVVLYSLAD